MIMFRPLSPEPFWLVQHHPVYSGLGSRHCHGINYTPSKILSYIYIPLSGTKVYGCDYDLVAELAKRLCQPPGVSLLSLRIRFAALLDKSHSLMQDLPNHAAEPMGDGPDGGLIAQPRQQTPEHRLKVTAVLLHRSV